LINEASLLSTKKCYAAQIDDGVLVTRKKEEARRERGESSSAA
jgi:hypothetical protein